MTSLRSLSTIPSQLLKDCVFKFIRPEWLPRRKSRQGASVYRPISLFMAQILGLDKHWLSATAIASELKDNPYYQRLCEFPPGKQPSHDTISLFQRKMTEKRLLTLIGRIDEVLTQHGAFDQDDLALDATDILSNGRNRHNPDPDAGFGYKTDKERFHGYWVVFLVGTVSELPRAVAVTPANVHQSGTAQDLFDDLENRDLRSARLLFADAAYDDKKTYYAAQEHDLLPLISYNPRNSACKSFGSLGVNNWRKLVIGRHGELLREKYRGTRLSVERYQATFKELLQGRTVPVRGKNKVTRYVLWATLVTQLCGLVNLSLKVGKSLATQTSLADYFPTPTIVGHLA